MRRLKHSSLLLCRAAPMPRTQLALRTARDRASCRTTKRLCAGFAGRWPGARPRPQFLLGSAYHYGLGAVQQDVAEAVRW